MPTQKTATDHDLNSPPPYTPLPTPARPQGPVDARSGSYSTSQEAPTTQAADERHTRYTGDHASAAFDEGNDDDNLAPPAYSELPGQINDENNDLRTNAVVGADGRVDIRINQKSRRLSRILTSTLESESREGPSPPPYVPPSLTGAPGQASPPPLNVVIHVVGSRGDVQPFIALGKVLRETYKHRVRLATHPVFKDFVIENGLEFFSIGGDPSELMAFMVKNPGLMPGFDTLRSGDVGKRRRGIAEIIQGTWRSCIETGNGLGPNPLKHTIEEWAGAQANLPEALQKPFVADVIIANPPSFGHIHCAEKLGVPLHMMFTMPWSPTQQFPHPLANIQATNADVSLTNYISYTLVDMLTWQGLGDVINRFRKASLGLEPISTIWAPNMLSRLKIPYTYCWSPALIPKPKDWGRHISVAGFYFLDLASNYVPEPALKDFLAAGEAPVYIGFGSIVVDDPDGMTRMIFEAVRRTGRRALVSKGWGGLGAGDLNVPEGVFMLGNVPHDWLFKHVSAVVHHGGAGTTAAGIRAGRPTVIVPFFGDQPFWGAMTAKAGAGPEPIAYKQLTATKLVDAVEQALKPESLERAKELADKISQEEGAQDGARSFHRMLHHDEIRCMVEPTRSAVWRVRRTPVRLSAKVAAILTQAGELRYEELKPYRPREYHTDEGPWDPVTGGATAIVGTATNMMMGVADLPIDTLKLLNIHPENRTGKGKQKVSDVGSSGNALDTTERASTATSSTDVEIPSLSSDVPGLNQAPGREDKSRPDDASQKERDPISSATTVRSPNRPSTPTSSTSRPPMPDRGKSTESSASLQREGPTFADKLRAMNLESAVGTGKGINKILGAGFKSPMDFTLNVAKGFHNVPRLYGQEVRQVDKVTDFQSGVKTAAKEFGLGFYEGLSGLVTDPYQGAKKEGGIGFIKGVGRGIAGVPLRVMGGVFAVPGYAMKGLYEEALKGKGAHVQNYIIAARISQGNDETQNVSQQEKEAILASWRTVKASHNKKKNVGEEQMETLQTLIKEKKIKRHQRWENLHSKLRGSESGTGRSSSSTGEHSSTQTGTQPAQDTTSNRPPLHTPGTQSFADEEAERHQLDAAIRVSVAESSRGNPSEDAMLAEAIRASLAELERPAPPEEDDDATLQRALNASLEEAGRHGASEKEQRMLEEALKSSLLGGPNQRRSESEWDVASDTEDDEEYQRIIAESREMTQHGSRQDEDRGAGDGHEDDLREVLQESEKAEREREEAIAKQAADEEIVMEYVKKQSLLEEEHRRRLAQGRDAARESS
ncbi:glycosyltransferase family 1 protein [Sporormia fimetaria CBS 119925]|uniref:Glycosyltransferase family 1 protein n=1 Tax=Sporormia fimetaria CBS 119925 TaxID=1340428 RepID=A0A6A6UZ80_9PLEO|nr:glycosyltransferase family 1 protein [Sporormia fimetaria CBS 119925]